MAKERIVIRITGTSVDTSLGELLCELMELTRVPYKLSYLHTHTHSPKYELTIKHFVADEEKGVAKHRGV